MADNYNSPQRTCISCRQTKEKKQLVRYVVAPDGAVLVDYRQRLPGRGAYTCISAHCLSNAVRRKSFQRCFTGWVGSLRVNDLEQQLNQAVVKKITSLVGMSRKSSQFISGTNAVIEVLVKGSSLALIIVATDISVTIGKKIEGLAQRKNIFCISLYDKQKIGQMLGKEERSVIAVKAGLLAGSLLNELHRYERLAREN